MNSLPHGTGLKSDQRVVQLIVGYTHQSHVLLYQWAHLVWQVGISINKAHNLVRPLIPFYPSGLQSTFHHRES